MYLLDPSHSLLLVRQSKRRATPLEVLDVACCQVECAHQSSLRAVSCRMCAPLAPRVEKSSSDVASPFKVEIAINADSLRNDLYRQQGIFQVDAKSQTQAMRIRRGRLDTIRLVLAIGESGHLSGDRGTAECHLQGQSEACRGAQGACGDGVRSPQEHAS